MSDTQTLEMPTPPELLRKRLGFDGRNLVLMTPEIADCTSRAIDVVDRDWDQAYRNAIGANCNEVTDDLTQMLARRLVAAYNATLDVPLEELEQQAQAGAE